MRFTEVEFYTMVNELLYQDPVSFDMLCRIADKTLRPSVVYWCKNEECLRGRGLEDDIMQEIYLRLIKTAVSGFLLREGVEGEYNNDPEGFEDWMFCVARNLKRDFANNVRRMDFKTAELDDSIGTESYYDEYDDSEDVAETLKQSLSIVLSCDVGIYKILTWLAQFIFILVNDVTKIRSNELIIATFEDKTLDEMYDMILTASKKIPWIIVTEEQNEKIIKSLRKIRKDNVSYGETKYKDFFMKSNGKISGKKSISDWVNRMNDMLKKRI